MIASLVNRILMSFFYILDQRLGAGFANWKKAGNENFEVAGDTTERR